MSDSVELSRSARVAHTLGLDHTPTARARRLRAALIGGAVVVALALGALVFGRSSHPVKYTTEPARRGDLTVTVTATGTLQPTVQVDVGSELSGTVRKVLVDFNDSVKVGQTLAVLDTSKLAAQVLQSKAAVAAANAKVDQTRASLAEAESMLERLKQVHEMSGGKVPSPQDMDAANASALRARADVSSAKAAVNQAQALLDAQLSDLGKAEIKSPIDGIVLKRAVEPGQAVAASLQAVVLFSLAEDLTRMELHISVDEADVGQVVEGQDAIFTVDAWPDRKFSARVSQVRFGAETLEGVVTYDTVLQVDNSERLLRPGMTATAEVTVKQLANALLVPNSALRFEPPARAEQQSGGILSALIPMRRFGVPRAGNGAAAKQSRVFVLNDDGRPQRVEVTPGASDGTWTELKKGEVKEGTELVVDSVAAK
jgi:HlyD family secretion protein